MAADEEFASNLARVIAQARADGLTDEAIIAGLEEAIDAIEEEMSDGSKAAP
jgi:uncharacterized membrane protein